MNREVHPIATSALSALSRDAAGHLNLDERAVEALRQALERLAAPGGARGPGAPAQDGLHSAIVALIEVAHILDGEGGPAAAKALRDLAAEFTVPLKAENERRRDGRRQEMARFARFSGQAAPARALPQAPARGGLRVADLLPPRVIMAR
jgi:hypothetical protein